MESILLFGKDISGSVMLAQKRNRVMCYFGINVNVLREKLNCEIERAKIQLSLRAASKIAARSLPSWLNSVGAVGWH